MNSFLLFVGKSVTLILLAINRDIVQINQQLLMFSNVLGEEQNVTGLQFKSTMRAQMKIQHLSSVNEMLRQEITLLNSKIDCQQQLIKSWQNNTKQSDQLQSLKEVVIKLRSQNSKLEDKFIQIVNQNKSLVTQRLLKQQIHEQATIEFQVAISTYQKKIFELRQSVQQKEIYIQVFQEKVNNKKTFFELSGTHKYCLNQFSDYLVPYQKLIHQLKCDLQIQRKKNRTGSNCQGFLKQAEHLNYKNKKETVQNVSLGYKTSKVLISGQGNNSTNLKPINSRTKQSQQENLLYLNATLQLKRTQNQLRNAKIKLKQFQFKERIMKQGYKILSKKIQQLNNEIFSLTIKNKSLTLQSIKNIKSQSTIFSHSAKQQKVQSQTNCESKNYLVEDSNLHIANNRKIEKGIEQKNYKIQENLSLQEIQESNQEKNQDLNTDMQNKMKASTDSKFSGSSSSRFQKELMKRPSLRNKQSTNSINEGQKDVSLQVDFSIDEQTFSRSDIQRKRAVIEFMEQVQFGF